MNKKTLLGINFTVGSYGSFVSEILRLGRDRISSYVCFSNVHMTIEAWRSPEFAEVVNGADIVAPDGVPLAKGLKYLYGILQDRVAGMDFLPDLIFEAERENLSIFFFGGSGDVLDRIVERVRGEHPNLIIAGFCSPPFRVLTRQEEESYVEEINQSGANLVMVALGCPKQEFWMARQRGKIDAVMLGVGGAFPVYAGIQKRAPVWMQKASLEWFFRFCQEPRRLFKRYFTTNILFLYLFLFEILRVRCAGVFRSSNLR